MALYVFLGLSAYSRPSTLLATRRCDLVKPAKGGSGPAKPSDTTRGCLLDSPYLNGLEDLFLAMSGVHDHRPIWNFTYPQAASTVSCCRSWAGNSDLLPASSLRRQRGHGSTISNAGCCSEERSLVASKKLAQVRTQQSSRSGPRKTASRGPNVTRRVHARSASPCESKTSRTHVAAGSGLHVAPLRTCLQEEKLLEPPRLKGSGPKLGTPFLTNNV